VTIDVAEDLGLVDYPGIKFVMWADPAVTTIARILTPLAKKEDDITPDDGDAFFDALNEVILDSNIEGIEFGSLEKVIKAYDHPHLPYGFVGTVATFYCMKIITDSEALKKVFNLPDGQETSGEDSKAKGNE
jgi:hypothetical protein